MVTVPDLIAIIVLVGLLITVAILVISIVFQCRWLVPFVPTPLPIVRTMVDLAGLKPDHVVIDLGAGDGRCLIEAKKREPRISAIGYEGALGVWLLAKVCIMLSGYRDIKMYRRNFFSVDLSSADVIFLYLSSHVMEKLVPKFQSELKPGTLIISHAFALPHSKPVRSADVPMFFGTKKTKVRCYRWKGSL